MITTATTPKLAKADRDRLANSSLTTGERKQLRQCEETIESGLMSFVEVGKALHAIKVNKLYSDTDETFEAYCKRKWQFAKSHAYRLIESAKVVEALSPIGDVPAPANEAQARPLTKVATDNERADLWVKACETAKRDADGNPIVTASHVAKTVAAYLAPEPDDSDEPEEEPEEVAAVVEEVEPAAEPNTLGAIREAMDAFYEQLLEGQPPHVKEFIKQHHRALSEVLEAT